jgi:hypothetical protein
MLSPGALSESIIINKRTDMAVTPVCNIKTVNSANQSSSSRYTITSNVMASTTKYLDITLESVEGATLPEEKFVVVSTTMPYTKIGTGGVISAPSTETVTLSTAPDFAYFVNRTGMDQKVSMKRGSLGDGQYSLYTFFRVQKGESFVSGSSPYIKDSIKRIITIPNGMDLQIYNCGGTTVCEWPSVSGLAMTSGVKGSGYGQEQAPNLGIGDVPVGTVNPANPDDPINPGVPDSGSPNADDYDKSIGGFMSWIKDSVSYMFTSVGNVFASIFSGVQQLGAMTGSMGNIMGDFLGLPVWLIAILTLGFTMPILSGIIARRFI